MEKNITTIASLNPSTILLLCQKIDVFKDDILNDIEKGTLSKDIDIPDDVRRNIEQTLKPNPKRSGELRNILKEKKKLLPKDIWPKMKLIECWKGGTVGLYLREFPRYFGNVPVRDFGYISSEARCSVPISDEARGGILAVGANFYEFIPKEDMAKKEKRFLLCNQLEEGGEYFVVLTTPGGLYRYNIDDLIRVVGSFNSTPVIEFVQKGINVTSVTGEKLYEAHVVEAVNNATNRQDLFVEFFTAYVQWGEIPRYEFLVEFAENPPPHKKKELLRAIDEELCLINMEYKAKRKSQRLNHPVLKVVSCGDFKKYRVKKVKEGAHDGQFKLPQLTQSENFCQHFTITEEISID